MTDITDYESDIHNLGREIEAKDKQVSDLKFELSKADAEYNRLNYKHSQTRLRLASANAVIRTQASYLNDVIKQLHDVEHVASFNDSSFN